MPVTEGLRVLTDSDRGEGIPQVDPAALTLNHPVDCGICDKRASASCRTITTRTTARRRVARPKVHSTKFHALSERIVLDNERCILCSRCVRFTREISKSNALGITQRGDTSLVRAREDGSFDADPYSDNVVDLARSARCSPARSCTSPASGTCNPRRPSVPAAQRAARSTSGIARRMEAQCARPGKNVRIERVTPRENPEVNGPWICNKGRDLAQIFERPRALEALVKGKPIDLVSAIAIARALIEGREAAGRDRVELGARTRSSRHSRHCCRTASKPSSSRTGCRSR
jgi:NADH-quinone oxidoreductase subunit G